MNKLSLISIPLICLGFVSLSIAESKQSQVNHSKGKYLYYKDFYTAEGFKKGGGTYQKDPHTWVYTSTFAKRFGMPEEWIDDSIKGAEALAFRYDLDVYGMKCGYLGEKENCQPSTACVLDMYIPDSADLPWNSETRYDSRYGYKSASKFKGDADEHKKNAHYSDRRTKYPRINKKGETVGYWYRMGLDIVALKYGSGDKAGYLGGYTMLEYDRDIYTGLDYVSGSVICGFPRYRDMRIRFGRNFLEKDGSIDHKKTNKLFLTGKSIEYRVYVPNSFMKRLEKATKDSETLPDSLYNQVKERLKNQYSK